MSIHSLETLAWLYDLCQKDDDCERGGSHEGPCGPADGD